MLFDQRFGFVAYGLLVHVLATVVGRYQIFFGHFHAQRAYKRLGGVVQFDERGLAHGSRNPVLLDRVLEILGGFRYFRGVHLVLVDRDQREQVDPFFRGAQQRQIVLELRLELVVESQRAFVLATNITGFRDDRFHVFLRTFLVPGIVVVIDIVIVENVFVRNEGHR